MVREPCIPPTLPVTALDWRRLLPLAGKANAALARYDGMLQALLNPAVLLSPVTANEAVLSSRIEGTVATLEEVLQQDAGIEQDPGRHADLEEIANYRAAMRDAEQELQHRPLSLSLIKGVHQQLPKACVDMTKPQETSVTIRTGLGDQTARWSRPVLYHRVQPFCHKH